MQRPVAEMIQLSALLDDELREAEAKAVRKKLIHSERLRREYEYLKALDRLLRKWDRADLRGIRASSRFEQNLRNRLRNLATNGKNGKSHLLLSSLYHG